MTVNELLLMLVPVLVTMIVMSIGWAKTQWWARLLKSEQMQQLGIKTAKTFGRSGFQGSLDSVALARVKKSKMDRRAIKDFAYGGIMELMRNRQYYYNSGVGSSYSHWTDEGKEVLIEYMTIVAGKMHDAEQAELDARAKELVLRELKGKDA
jgi:hypothetical protein